MSGGCVKGKKGPCNGHLVLVEFSGSATVAYRSGAGSIYPVLKRLHEAGLVSLTGRRYSITQKGLEELRSWLTSGSNEVSTSLDPIRSRVYFLEVLDPAERIAFVNSTLGALRSLLENCEATLRGYIDAGSDLSALAMEGALYETRARIEWLEGIRERLATQKS